jgi:hypothetical protein
MRSCCTSLGIGPALAIVAGLAGCRDSDPGAIRANQRAAAQVAVANSDRPVSPSKLRSNKKPPDYDDLSPRLRGREAQP